MTLLETTNIILIGPSGAGKTTLGQLLAARLKLSALELDDLRWSYHDELGYDREHAAHLRGEQGFAALVAYWEPFTIHALERVLQDYPVGCVLSTSAGNVVFDNAEYTARAKKVLKPYPFVVLLLPSPDVNESIRICKDRIVMQNPDMQDVPDGPLAVNASFIQRRDYHDVATITIYNNTQTPEETCAAIIQAVQPSA